MGHYRETGLEEFNLAYMQLNRFMMETEETPRITSALMVLVERQEDHLACK